MNPAAANPMRNISPHPDGWLVRFCKKNKIHQKFFTHEKLANAKRWRDAMEKFLYKEGRSITPNLRVFKHPNVREENKDLPIGASYNRRKRIIGQNVQTEFRIQYTYRIFDAHNKKIVKTRGFYIGFIDRYSESSHQHALRTVRAFDEEYRHCVVKRLPFHAQKYIGWRQKTLHMIPLAERVKLQVGSNPPQKVYE